VVDEARYYLSLDLVASGHVAALAHVKGAGFAPMDAPRYNYTRDPYFTDGLRLVVFLAERRVAYGEIERLEWETPPDRMELAGQSGD
jgi:hypothetical protein